jgi:hypothetical protein
VGSQEHSSSLKQNEVLGKVELEAAEPGPSSGRLAHYLLVVAEQGALPFRSLGGNGSPLA